MQAIASKCIGRDIWSTSNLWNLRLCDIATVGYSRFDRDICSTSYIISYGVERIVCRNRPVPLSLFDQQCFKTLLSSVSWISNDKTLRFSKIRDFRNLWLSVLSLLEWQRSSQAFKGCFISLWKTSYFHFLSYCHFRVVGVSLRRFSFVLCTQL